MSNIDFTGRVAIITGSGGGLGRQYALDLAARGASIVVNDIWAEPDGGGRQVRIADKVVQEIQSAGGRAVATYDSVGTRAGADRLVQAAMDQFGRVDIVINNAGNQANNRFELMSDEDYEAVLAVHLKGAFYLTQTAYKQMMARQYGRVLFTSSSSGMLGHYIRTNYASAKAGLIGLMHSVSLEGARYGIMANALLPMAGGGSNRLGKVPPGTLWPEWEKRMPENQPEMSIVGPAMTLANVSPLVVYLVSEACKSTHAMYSTLGGRYARVFIGVTRGWLANSGRSATPEEVEAHFAEISDAATYEEYGFLTDEVLAVARRIKSESGG